MLSPRWISILLIVLICAPARAATFYIQVVTDPDSQPILQGTGVQNLAKTALKGMLAYPPEDLHDQFFFGVPPALLRGEDGVVIQCVLAYSKSRAVAAILGRMGIFTIPPRTDSFFVLTDIHGIKSSAAIVLFWDQLLMKPAPHGLTAREDGLARLMVSMSHEIYGNAVLSQIPSVAESAPGIRRMRAYDASIAFIRRVLHQPAWDSRYPNLKDHMEEALIREITDQAKWRRALERGTSCDDLLE